MTWTTVPLNGVRAHSLGSYLSALGLLRAAARHEDWRDARASWRDGHFVLQSQAASYGRELLRDWLLCSWQPTPFKKWWQKVQAASKKDPDAVAKSRASISDDHVDDLDLVMVVARRRVFNDLLGTGGNVGKRDLSKVWETCCARRKKPKAPEWLDHALFGDDNVELPELRGAGTWFVHSNKTFNSGQSWYREGHLSPWSFLLAMEGMRLLPGGAHRRHGLRVGGEAVYPFMCRPVEPPTRGQVGHGKSEFWAPIWRKPATLLEIEAMFRTGLAEMAGRPASAPHEFAIAALGAGTDAGIDAFARFALRHTTSVQVYEAIPQPHVSVGGKRAPEHRHSWLLTSLIESRWLDRLPFEPRDSKQRGKFVGLRGPIEAAIVHLSEEPDEPERWRNLLLLIACTQQRVDRNKKLRERCMPVPKLHANWFNCAWPEPPMELQVARAIASIQASPRVAVNTIHSIDPLLVNIFGVEITRRGKRVFPKARPNKTVWNEGGSTRALIDLLRRRLIDANELDLSPLHGSQPCSIAAVASYLAGPDEFDDELLTRWLPALTLIGWMHRSNRERIEPGNPLHPLYSLFRPLFDPSSINVNDRPLFPLSESDSRKPHAAAIRRIVNLLLQNQIDEAVAHARCRYLSAGWRTFDPPAHEMVFDAERLAAALLIPVNPAEVAIRFRRDWLILSTDQR